MFPFLAALDPTPLLGREGPDLTRYVTVCGLLILTLAGLAFAFRRLFAGAIAARARGRSLRVIDVLPLGGKRQLNVVRVYDRTFVLGLSERDVNLVAELDAADLPADSERTPGPDADQREAFTRLLERAKQRVQPAGPRRARVDTLVDEHIDLPTVPQSRGREVLH